jgi:ribokinase
MRVAIVIDYSHTAPKTQQAATDMQQPQPSAEPSHARIAVVGSLMMDLVVRVPRLPAPGESLLGHEFKLFTGGKGANQAIAAARLGAAHVSIIGRVGEDDFGRRIVAALEADGVDCRGIIRDRRRGTGVAVPMVFDNGENSIISLPQANLALSAADVRAMASRITEATMLLLQCEVGAEATATAIGIAREARIPVLLNAAPITADTPLLVRDATHLVVNEVEAAALAPAADGDHVAEAKSLLGERPGTVVVTLGEEGALLARPGSTHFIRPFQVETVDSVGAGDAFCAAYAVALADGFAAPEAAEFASAAGALAVTQPGAQSALPRRAEVESLRRRRPSRR